MTFDKHGHMTCNNPMRLSLIGGVNLIPRDPNKLPEPESSSMPPTQRSITDRQADFSLTGVH